MTTSSAKENAFVSHRVHSTSMGARADWWSMSQREGCQPRLDVQSASFLPRRVYKKFKKQIRSDFKEKQCYTIYGNYQIWDVKIATSRISEERKITTGQLMWSKKAPWGGGSDHHPSLLAWHREHVIKQGHLKGQRIACISRLLPFFLSSARLNAQRCGKNNLVDRTITHREKSQNPDHLKKHIYHEENLLKHSYSIPSFISCFLHNLMLKFLFSNIYTPDLKLPEAPFNLNSP